jgi:hypothetical protein
MYTLHTVHNLIRVNRVIQIKVELVYCDDKNKTMEFQSYIINHYIVLLPITFLYI